MSAVDNCTAAIKKLFTKPNQEIPEGTVRKIVEALNDEKSRFFHSGPASGEEFNRKAAIILANVQYEALAARRQALVNMVTNQKNYNFGTQPKLMNKPYEAIAAKIAGQSTKAVEGGNKGIKSISMGRAARLMSALDVGLRKAGLDNVMRSGSMDRDMFIELGELKEGGHPGKSGNPLAVEGAKVFKAINTKILGMIQDAGSAVREMQGYIIRQSHDREKIVQAGYDEWKAYISPRLDVERTFGTMRDKEAFLKGVFEDIRDGKYGGLVDNGIVSDQFFTKTGGTQNISNKTSRARSLHFKDGEAFYDYNSTFGRKNLMESTMAAIQKASLDSALMETFGTNTEAGYQRYKENLRTLYTKADNQGALDQLKRWEPYLDAMYRTASGQVDNVARGMYAKGLDISRNTLYLVKNGAAIFAHMTNLPVAVSQLEVATGKSWTGTMAQMASNWVQSIAGKTFGSGAEKEVAGKLSVAIGNMREEMMRRFGGENSQPGMMTKAVAMLHKYSGIGPMVDSARAMSAKLMAGVVAEHANTPWEALPEEFRTHLERFSIDEPQWRHYSRAVEDVKGQSLVTVEGLENVPHDFFGSRREHSQAVSNLISLYNDIADYAGTSPGIRERTALNVGLDNSGFWGPTLRTVAMFKSIPLMLWGNTQRIYQTGGTVALAKYGAAAFTMAYVERQLYRMATGKNTQSITDPEALQEAFVRSGIGGLWADMFAGEAIQREGLVKGNIGPVFSQADDWYQMVAKTAKGDSKAKQAQMKVINDMTPNFWITKGVLDHYFIDHLKEQVSPGYIDRKEIRDLNK